MTLKTFQDAVSSAPPQSVMKIEVDGQQVHGVHNIEIYQSWDGVDIQTIIIRIKTTEN